MIYVEDIETTGIGNHLFLGVRKGLDSKGLGHIAPWMGEEAPSDHKKEKVCSKSQSSILHTVPLAKSISISKSRANYDLNCQGSKKIV